MSNIYENETAKCPTSGDISEHEYRLNQAKQAMCMQGKIGSDVPAQPVGAFGDIASLLPRLYTRRQHLQRELDIVREAINSLEKDATIQKLIAAAQAAH